MRQHDEQNSVTLTTTASTQFDGKTVVLNSLLSGSGSVVEEPINLPKKTSQNQLKSSNKLAFMATALKIDSKIKEAEDEYMQQRKSNLR